MLEQKICEHQKHEHHKSDEHVGIDENLVLSDLQEVLFEEDEDLLATVWHCESRHYNFTNC